MTDSVSKNVKVESDSSRPAGFEPGLSVLERYALKGARTVLRGGGDGNVASLPDGDTVGEFSLSHVSSLNSIG